MNKKTLFFILLTNVALVLPFVANGQKGSPACIMINSVSGALNTIAITMVVIGWIIAGIMWLVSMGSPEKTGTAKKATFAAAIGTVVVILANSAYAAIWSLLGGTGTPGGGC